MAKDGINVGDLNNTASTNDAKSYVAVDINNIAATKTKAQAKSGLIGKLIGANKGNATLSIALILCLLLLGLILFCLIYFDLDPKIDKYLELLFSLLTMIIGYIFGRA